VFNAATRTITWTIPSVPAFTAVTVTFTANVSTPLDDGTSIANQGTLSCPGCGAVVLTDDPATAASDDPTVVVVGSSPVLSVRKTVVDDDGGLVDPGDILTWTIVVENTGDSCADNVVVVDPIDANLGDVQPQQGGVLDPGTQTVTWSSAGTPALVRLCPGAVNAATVVVRTTIDTPLADGTQVCDQVNVRSDELTVPVVSDDPGTAAAGDATCVNVVSAAVLSDASKTVVDANGAPVRPGDALGYTISFTNQGNAVATGVVVRDPIDPSLTNVVPGEGGTFTGSEILWDASTTPALAAVAPGQTVTLSFIANVVTPLDDGTVIANQAAISAGGLPVPVLTDDPSTAAVDDPTVVVVVAAAAVTAEKTVSDENGGVAAPGDVFLYTIKLANAGDALRLLDDPPWPVETLRGQISLWPQPRIALPRIPIAGAGYLLPEIDGHAVFGATSQSSDDDPTVRDTDHAHNLAQLARLTNTAIDVDPQRLLGRTAWRWVSDDRLPIIGAVPDRMASSVAGTRLDQPRFVPRLPGLFVFAALGSRGITWAALGAQLLASAVSGAPLPLESSLLDAVDPARFVTRQARRARRE